MTFRKLEERSRAFAAYLQQGLGLKKGDRVALMMPNLLQHPVALFGDFTCRHDRRERKPAVRLASWNISSTIAARRRLSSYLTLPTRWKK